MKSFLKQSRWTGKTAVAIALLLGGGTMSPVSAAISGEIGTAEIEIDTNANLYPSSTSVTDWVKDSLPNTDAPSLSQSIATGVIVGSTGAVAKGHWNGVRIVDGIAGNDQDIFLTGGKENDTNTWNVGPGSVGSSKYDITQAYLANNRTKLFFGMERRGNNGTTAFDFEFNQEAPATAKPTIPRRTVGDVLFTFEMSGSGSSGSATPHYYTWNGSAYVEKSGMASLKSSINTSPVPAAPWGYVDSQGNWTTGNLPNFSFAEASVNVAEAFPYFTACTTTAYVQVRTRSSSTATSDLKDTTKIFAYQFSGPKAASALSGGCAQSFSYSSAGSKDSLGGTSLSYLWKFKAPAGVTLSGTGVTGPDANGYYSSTLASGTVNVGLPAGVNSASITSQLTVSQSDCSSTSDVATTQTITVLRALAAAITSKVPDGNTMSVDLTGSAPTATSVQWQKLVNGVWTDIAGATSATFNYKSFEADSVATDTGFSLGGSNYDGKIWQVSLRLRATRVANGVTCNAVSAPVVLKKITAVDP